MRCLMENYFLKKCPLSEEDKKQLQKELLYYGKQEEQYEDELESIRETLKSQIKTKESEMMYAKTKRREIQSILLNEYRMLDVPCKHFIDHELKKEITIQLQTLELLDVKDINPYVNYTLEFDEYNVIELNEDKLKKLITSEPEVFAQIPNKLIYEDNNIPEFDDYLIFGYDIDIRVAKLDNNLTYNSLLDIIKKEAANFSIDM